MMANLISILRTVLCLIVVLLLFQQQQTIYITCFFLTVAVIWMDGLDGYVARKLNESSKSGAVIDILGDRIVEQVYWVSYLALGWVPLWVPLIVIVRGIIVDGLRSMALEQGYTAFGETTMMQSKIGWLLVSSRFSRWSYAFFKAAAFAFLILGYTPNMSAQFNTVFLNLGYAGVYISLFFCVVRGLPVLIEGRRFLFEAKS